MHRCFNIIEINYNLLSSCSVMMFSVQVRTALISEVLKAFVAMILFTYMVFLRGRLWIAVIELELPSLNKIVTGR